MSSYATLVMLLKWLYSEIRHLGRQKTPVIEASLYSINRHNSRRPKLCLQPSPLIHIGTLLPNSYVIGRICMLADGLRLQDSNSTGVVSTRTLCVHCISMWLVSSFAAIYGQYNTTIIDSTNINLSMTH